MLTPKNENELKKYVYYLLSKREYSTIGLKTKLKQYNNDNNIIDKIISEFQDKNLQSDIRFSRSLIESKSSKYGNLRLIYELENNNIDSNIYYQFLPNEKEEINNAIKILEKKFKQLDNIFTNKQKYINFLQYRGFSYDIINQVLKNIK